ncbi:hypothetical protein Fmac_028274 [Flemingia macrophylla]|uniref:Uncharacterized protein n=1 Tax=Flemingia macrophylla TaxID=520843 RepID=A0ABD1L714_9FABA
MSVTVGPTQRTVKAVLQGNDQNEIEICVESGFPVVEEFDGTHLVFVRAGSDSYEVITNFVRLSRNIDRPLHSLAKWGILQPDMWGVTPSNRWDWNALPTIFSSTLDMCDIVTCWQEINGPEYFV